MTTSEQLKLIDEYISDETKLYEAFYQQVIHSGGDDALQPIAIPPSLEEMKELAKQYLINLQEPLRRLFCEVPLHNGLTVCANWQLVKKLPDKWKDLINAILVDAALAVALIHIQIPQAVVVFTLVTISGFIDEICGSCLQNVVAETIE